VSLCANLVRFDLVQKGEGMRQLACRVPGQASLLAMFLILATLSPGPLDTDAAAEEPSPLTVGDYRLSGAVSAGYRLVDIDSGREELYDEVVNAKEGVQLFDFTLQGEHTDTDFSLVDRFRVEAANIGDSHPYIRLTASKDEAYELTANFRQSEFFVDRIDDAFTGNRDFDTKRRFGDVNLTLLPFKPLRVHLFFHGIKRDGNEMVPRLVENNVFVLRDDPDELTLGGGVAVEFVTRTLTVRLEQSYRHFDDEGLVSLPTPGLQGLRTDPPFATMQLDAFREERDHEVKTWMTRLRLRASPSPRWEVTGGYVFAHSSGNAQLQGTESGVGRAGTSGPNETFTAVLTSDGDMSRNLHIVEVGTSYALLSNLSLHLDYRYHLIDEDSDGFLTTRRTGVLTGMSMASETGSQHIKTQAHTLTPAVEFLPWPTLTLRAGYRYQWRDVKVEQFVDGVQIPDNPLAAAPHQDRTTLGNGVVLSAAWRYRSLLQASVHFVGDYFDDPYTRISPTRDQRLRVQVRVSPTPWLTVSETYALADIANSDTDNTTQSQSWTTGLFVQPLAPLMLEGSVTYEELDNHSDTAIPINGVRTPVTFINDSETLNWTASGTLDLPANFRVRAYASWTRVYGEGKSSYVFPGGEVSYLWKKPALRLTARYERPYVIEREPLFDSFYAHIATFMLTKEF
jgi:hypothetical protein